MMRRGEGGAEVIVGRTVELFPARIRGVDVECVSARGGFGVCE
jgi:hypothetical protein